MLKVLGRTTSSNVQKVLWLLAELKVPFEREDYGGKFGRNKEPEYLKLNPNGLVPTLIDDDLVLWESNTICRYLANRFNGHSVYPAAPAERALCERWMDWQLTTLGPVMVPLFQTLVRLPKEQWPDTAAMEQMRQRATAVFMILNQALNAHDYLQGPELTLADIPNGMWAHRWFALKLNDPRAKNVEAWYQRLRARPAFRQHILIPLE